MVTISTGGMFSTGGTTITYSTSVLDDWIFDEEEDAVTVYKAYVMNGESLVGESVVVAADEVAAKVKAIYKFNANPDEVVVLLQKIGELPWEDD